jgi:hypothetical protein
MQHREKLAQEHRLDQLLMRYQTQAQSLLGLYEDASGHVPLH